MSKVSKEEIRRLAELASLLITEEELDKRVEELNNVLAYTAMMNQVSNVSPAEPDANTSATPVVADLPHESFSPEKAMLNAPDRQDIFFKVPRMIGE